MKTFIIAALAAIAYADIVTDDEVIEDHCCKFYAASDYQIDTDDLTESQANQYSTMDVCLKTSLILETHLVTAKSFRGGNGDVDDSYFNDTMESFRCGQKVGAAICDVIYHSEQLEREDWGMYTKLTCSEKTLSTSAPGEWNPDYFLGMNRASAVILYPADACITMYTMYEGDNCRGRSKSSNASYKT